MDPVTALTLYASLALNVALFTAVVWQRDQNDKLRDKMLVLRPRDSRQVARAAQRTEAKVNRRSRGY